VDVAVFPALFADYLKFWWPAMSGFERAIVVIAFVWILTGLNLAGVRITGWAAAALGAVVLAPVAVFTAVAASQAHRWPWLPFMNDEKGLIGEARPRACHDDVELLWVGHAHDVPRRDPDAGHDVPPCRASRCP
jgi:amino acid transporter